ncbi:hypothetical protein [Actinomadura sp. BRA 177]
MLRRLGRFARGGQRPVQILY